MMLTVSHPDHDHSNAKASAVLFSPEPQTDFNWLVGRQWRQEAFGGGHGMRERERPVWSYIGLPLAREPRSTEAEKQEALSCLLGTETFRRRSRYGPVRKTDSDG